MAIELKQQVFELLPVGEYKAAIVDIEPTEGTYGNQLAFTFIIEGGDSDGASMKGWCAAKFSNRSKLYAWTKAAFGGRDIPADYTFNSDDLLGRKVVLTIVQKAKEDGTEYNKIERIRAVVNGVPVVQPEATQPALASTAPAEPPAPFPPADDQDDDIPF